MDLFDIYENTLIGAITEAINFAENGSGSITKKEFSDILRKRLGSQYNALIPSDMLDTGVFGLFTIDSGENMTPVIDAVVPTVLPVIERDALANSMTLTEANYFFSNNEKNKIEEILHLSNLQTEWSEHDIEKKHVSSIDGQKAKIIRENIKIIEKAIEEKKAIKVVNDTKSGKKITSVVYPLNMEYTVNLATWTLNAWGPERGQPINLNISRLESIEITGTVYPDRIVRDYQQFVSSHKKRCMIRLEPVHHALDRIFRLFSYYEREVTMSSDDDCYVMKVSYYDFDERSLIRNILSAGEYAEVVSPEPLRQQIINEIGQCISNT